MISLLWTLSNTNLFEKSFPIKNLTSVTRARHLRSLSLYNCHTSRRGKLDIVSLFRFNIKHLYTRKAACGRNLACPKPFRVLRNDELGIVTLAYSQLLRLFQNNLSNRYKFSLYYATVKSKVIFFFAYSITDVIFMIRCRTNANKI